MLNSLDCEQAHLRVTRASDEGQSDPAGKESGEEVPRKQPRSQGLLRFQDGGGGGEDWHTPGRLYVGR